MSKTIALTQGRVAIVDNIDFEWLNQWRWCATKNGMGYYAVRSIRVNGKKSSICMHRVILNPPVGMETDHRNGNGLDNRRCNLRSCTRSQNTMNSRKRAGCSSSYKGVSWDKDRQRWVAKINRQFIGRFDDEEKAARAYDTAARELFGEFARPNLEAADACPAGHVD